MSSRGEPDVCDACGDRLEDMWVAVGSTDDPSIACSTCAPIIVRIDQLLEAGMLDIKDACREFERVRWGQSDARRSRGLGPQSDGELPKRMPDVGPEFGVVSSPTELSPCSTT